jgi:hypothetical protein
MTIKNKIVDHQLFKQAKIALLFLSFMCVGAYAEAQNFQSTSSYLNSSSPQTVEQTAAASPQQAYKSTIYEPFSSATPSSDANGSNNGNARGMSGRRNLGENTSGNPGADETQSPIGEPWIMLAFAAMTAVALTLRKKQTA